MLHTEFDLGIKGNNALVMEPCGACGGKFRPAEFALFDRADKPICRECGIKIAPDTQRLLDHYLNVVTGDVCR